MPGVCRGKNHQDKQIPISRSASHSSVKMNGQQAVLQLLLTWKEQTHHLQMKKALFDTHQVQLLLRPALEQFVALVLVP